MFFVKNFLAVKIGTPISYANHPKMRVHLATTESISKWHKDFTITGQRDHLNLFLPFTSCFGTNTLWCESDYDFHDFQPINLNYGQALIFDGGFLTHGTVKNTIDITRVSLDFRFRIIKDSLDQPWSCIVFGRLNFL
jgi:hypothetical protein